MSIGRLDLHAARFTGVLTNTTIQTSLAAVSVGTVALGQFFAFPVKLPADFDVSYPSRLRFLVARGAGAIDNVGTVRFNLSWNRINVSQAPASNFLAQTWTPPANWLVNDPQPYLWDNGGGNTFAAHAFQADDLLGILLGRNGADVLDTYANPILFPLELSLDYTRRCCRCCGL